MNAWLVNVFRVNGEKNTVSISGIVLSYLESSEKGLNLPAT